MKLVLFTRMLSWAMNQGIYLLTSEVSITARSFFEKMGFCVVKAQAVERQGIQFQNFRMEMHIDL